MCVCVSLWCCSKLVKLTMWGRSLIIDIMGTLHLGTKCWSIQVSHWKVSITLMFPMFFSLLCILLIFHLMTQTVIIHTQVYVHTDLLRRTFTGLPKDLLHIYPQLCLKSCITKCRVSDARSHPVTPVHSSQTLLVFQLLSPLVLIHS